MASGFSPAEVKAINLLIVSLADRMKFDGVVMLTFKAGQLEVFSTARNAAGQAAVDSTSDVLVDISQGQGSAVTDQRGDVTAYDQLVFGEQEKEWFRDGSLN